MYCNHCKEKINTKWVETVGGAAFCIACYRVSILGALYKLKMYPFIRE